MQAVVVLQSAEIISFLFEKLEFLKLNDLLNRVDFLYSRTNTV